MKTLKQLALATAVLAVPFMAQAELKAMDDSSLSSVTGQAGISISGSFNGSIGKISYIDDGNSLNLETVAFTGFNISDTAPVMVDVVSTDIGGLMIEILLGSLIGVWGFTEAVDTKPPAPGTVHINQHLLPNGPLRETVTLEPMSQLQFRNVIRQAYDYSCGSAALTSVLDYFLGRNLQERQVMEGLLQFGEADKIVERRGFSLLDMKRFVTALGYKSGGFRAAFADLDALEHPAIVPIEYAGFKHFVVVRDVYNDHVFVADPALGNISFTRTRFEEIWDQNVLFVIFPNGNEPPNALALSEQDLRIIDDRTISLLAFREFPQMTKFTENQATELGSEGDIRYIRRK